MANALTSRGLNQFGFERFLPVFLGVAMVVPSMYLLLHGQWRMLVMLIFLGILLASWQIDRGLAICLNFAYLFLLGDIRRITTLFTGDSGQDPLLLVSAAFALYVALSLFRKLRVKDSLSKVMLTFLGVMILEIFNPRQGSLLVGLSAGLFWIVPVLWFWIGREYATEALLNRLIFKFTVPLGIFAALLGLYQTFVGFPPWEQAWIDAALNAGYTSLLLAAGQVRAFGFSVNGIEFVNLLVLTSLAMGAAVANKRLIYLLMIPVMLASIFLASSRMPIVKVVLGFAVIWAVRGYKRSRRTLIPRLVFASVIGMGGLIYSVRQAAGTEDVIDARSTKSDVATAHVVQGLADPFNSSSSTAGYHTAMFKFGILNGIENPVGYGLGSVTLGAGKFSSDGTTGSSEVDISDSFLAMGVAGGTCFLLMMYFTTRYMLEYLSYGNKQLAYGLAGIFIGLLGAWIPQGQYAIAPIMCFLMGFLTRQHIQRSAMRESQALS